MDEHASGGRRRRRRRADPSPLPLLSDDLLVEILLRLPPEPIYLFRASFVSKHWRGLVHDARFLRRFREFHGGTPPVLGFFNNQLGSPFFVPTVGAFALSTAAKMSTDDWWALDCRHGRALLIDRHQPETLLVWDLVTGDKRCLTFPPAYSTGRHWSYNGVVLCAAGHGDCHSSPFLVAFMFTDHYNFTTSVCVYTSETGVWGKITSIAVPDASVLSVPTPLVGNTLYWMLDNNTIVDADPENKKWVIEFDMDTHSLDLTGELPYDVIDRYGRRIIIMPADDGRLGFAGVDGFSLHLWSSVAFVDGRVTWAHCRVIDLERLLAPEAVVACMHPSSFMRPPEAVGYTEDANVIFIFVYPSIYMINLNSMQIEEVSEKGNNWFVFPYTSFYSPGITIGGGDDQTELLNGS